MSRHPSFSLPALRSQARLSKGFSLRESLTVVTVIGIVAAASVITSSTNPGIASLLSVTPTGASVAGASTLLYLTWNTLVELGGQPIRQSSKDVAVIRLTRLTRKLTVYRQ